MKNIFFALAFCLLFITNQLSLHASTLESAKRAAAYIDKAATLVAKQLSTNEKYYLKNKRLYIAQSIDDERADESRDVTKRLNEALLYALTLEGFEVLNATTPESFQTQALQSKLILLSSVAHYKEGFVLTFRVVERESAVILSVAKVNIPRRVIREIRRVYLKDGWFER